MRKHGWIILMLVWLLLFASVAQAESPAAPQAEPAKSLVFLYNTSVREKDADTLALTQLLLEPLWVHTLQVGGQAIVMQAEYKGNDPVTNLLDAANVKDIGAQLDQMPTGKNENVPESNDGTAKSVFYQLKAAESALATLQPSDNSVDLWIVNRFSEPEARWRDGSFSGEGYKAMNDSVELVEKLLEKYPGLIIRMLFFTDKQSGDKVGLSEGMHLPEEIAPRFSVDTLNRDYVHNMVSGSIGYLWILDSVTAQVTDTGYIAEPPAGIKQPLLLVDHSYETVDDISLLQDDLTIPCAWYSAGGSAWITPTAEINTGKPLTVTLSGTATRDIMHPECTVTPFLYASNLDLLQADIEFENAVDDTLYRGTTRLIASFDVTEVPQELLHTHVMLTLPGGKGSQELTLERIDSNEYNRQRWACEVDLNEIGDYKASFMVDAGNAFSAEKSVSVVNRAPEANETEPFHTVINVPKVGNPSIKVQLSDLFTDADGDELVFTPGFDTDTSTVSLDAKAGTLTFTPGEKATDKQKTEVHITANDGHGGTAETAITLVCDDFFAKMEGLSFQPTDGGEANPTVNAGQDLTLTYALEDNATLQWYQGMKDVYGPDVMPELVDALSIVMTDKEGNEYTTADEALDGFSVALKANADNLPEVSVHVPASVAAGEQRLKFAVAYQGESLDSESFTLANANITVTNTAPLLKEGFAEQESATLLFNDLPFVGGEPTSMSQSLHEDVIPASMFGDNETPDSLSYSVAVDGTATVNGTVLANEDGQHDLTAEEASAPLDIQLGQVGRTTVTITASDGELTASRSWSLTLISLLMVVSIALVVLVIIVILVLVIRYLRRPTFAGKAIYLEQYGEGHIITMSKELWLDGMTLAQAAIMAGILPYDQLSADVLAGIRLEPGRRKTYRLTVSGKAAKIKLYNADTRTQQLIKEPLREDNRYDVVLESSSLRIIIGNPSAMESEAF